MKVANSPSVVDVEAGPGSATPRGCSRSATHAATCVRRCVNPFDRREVVRSFSGDAELSDLAVGQAIADKVQNLAFGRRQVGGRVPVTTRRACQCAFAEQTRPSATADIGDPSAAHGLEDVRACSPSPGTQPRPRRRQRKSGRRGGSAAGGAQIKFIMSMPVPSGNCRSTMTSGARGRRDAPRLHRTGLRRQPSKDSSRSTISAIPRRTISRSSTIITRVRGSIFTHEFILTVRGGLTPSTYSLFPGTADLSRPHISRASSTAACP